MRSNIVLFMMKRKFFNIKKIYASTIILEQIFNIIFKKSKKLIN